MLIVATATVAAMLPLSGCGRSIGAFRVAGASMLPLLGAGDRIFVDETDSVRSNLHDGDVVVFHHKDTLTVKRIVAMEGETIGGDHGSVIRDGKQLDEPYLAQPKSKENDALSTFPARKIGAGEIFVMGDNRGVSADSRLDGYGPVHLSDVVGRYTLTYWHAK